MKFTSLSIFSAEHYTRSISAMQKQKLRHKGKLAATEQVIILG